MTWFRVDDAVTEHPKCAGLSPFAWTLWLHALAYCSRNLTDGHIPAAMLTRLSGIRNPAKAAAELVEAGLWNVVGDGWAVHDYTDHQRSKARIEKDRAENAQRQAKHRKAQQQQKSQRNHANSNGVTKTVDTDTDNPTPPKPPPPNDADPLDEFVPANTPPPAS